MPGRLEPLVKNGIYHVFNKTIDSKNIFVKDNICRHLFNLSKYYRSEKARISFSRLKDFSESIREEIVKATIPQKYYRVEILSYCLMPTHFHMLLKQKTNNGIEKFMSDIINAFTRFHNLKHERKGPIFLPRFKSVMIQKDEQLLHVSRYIHLNPYSSLCVNTYSELIEYYWSSYREYIGSKKDGICQTDLILGFFNHDRAKYKQFVEDNADHQRSLEFVKYIDRW